MRRAGTATLRQMGLPVFASPSGRDTASGDEGIEGSRSCRAKIIRVPLLRDRGVEEALHDLRRGDQTGSLALGVDWTGACADTSVCESRVVLNGGERAEDVLQAEAAREGAILCFDWLRALMGCIVAMVAFRIPQTGKTRALGA